MKRVQYEHSIVPYLFVAPQIAIIAVFFLWPAAQAMQQSFLLEDAFGLSSQFVWFRNYEDMVFSEPSGCDRSTDLSPYHLLSHTLPGVLQSGGDILYRDVCRRRDCLRCRLA